MRNPTRLRSGWRTPQSRSSIAGSRTRQTARRSPAEGLALGGNGMAHDTRKRLTRRGFFECGAAAAGLVLAGLPRPSLAQGKTATKVLDFETYADVAKAEAEGEL